jgi:hypothetical protein
VIKDEGQQQDAGPDHVLAGKGCLLDGLYGILLGTSATVLYGQLDTEPDVNTGEEQQAEPKSDNYWSRQAVEVVGVGINAARKPSEDGTVAEQMDDSKKNHCLACDCHQNFSAD